jgi:hypothetical protein
MARITQTGRRWPTIVGVALAAIVIGALFGSFRNGSAAIAVKPANSTVPTIAGTPQQDSTLTAGNGSWTGTAPITFTYQWNRCDSQNCTKITGATENTYAVVKADVGNTLTVVVTATNSDGTDAATSKPTAAVTSAPAATGCPSGSGVIQIADLSPPAQLDINTGQSTPGIITPGSSTIQLKFTITACGGRPVQGALVYATAVPYNQYSIPPEPTTDANGNATLTMNQLTGFPASAKLAQLTVFVRARKNGEDILAGVSNRRLVSFPVNLK